MDILVSYDVMPPKMDAKKFFVYRIMPGPRSRGSTLRTKSRPLGRKDSKAVQLGNLLTARALVLILIIASKGCWWVLEQPSTSLMEYHPLFQAMLRLLSGVVRKTIDMSQYGAPTKKRTFLYSSHFAWNLKVCFAST